MISKKLRHETHLDFEMRKKRSFLRAPDKRDVIVIHHKKRSKSDAKKVTLDSQGRHRSEWCYSPYDGRAESPNEKTRETWEIMLDRYSALLR